MQQLDQARTKSNKLLMRRARRYPSPDKRRKNRPLDAKKENYLDGRQMQVGVFCREIPVWCAVMQLQLDAARLR
jgi:hypothetical protein